MIRSRGTQLIAKAPGWSKGWKEVHHQRRGVAKGFPEKQRDLWDPACGSLQRLPIYSTTFSKEELGGSMWRPCALCILQDLET